MPKLRKLRKAQKFRYHVNRKRIAKSQESTRNDRIKVNNKVMKELWNPKESVRSNMTTMGVAFDANDILSNKSTKATFIEKAKSAKSPETPKIVEKTKITENSGKTEVIKRLEAQVSEAENNKKSNFRFTPDQVKWITYCLDKHGDDFKAMARDPKNIWQETPKQIRQKVLKFITIPEQFAVYAKERGLLE